MRRKFDFRLVFAFLLLSVLMFSGGCGGGDGGNGGTSIFPRPSQPSLPTPTNPTTPPPGGTGDYSFSDFEGTWVLLSGTGNASGISGGIAGTGTAVAKSGSLKIWNVQVLSATEASCEYIMQSIWDVTLKTNVPGYTNYNRTVNLGSDSEGEGVYNPDLDSWDNVVRKIGPNVFSLQYNYSGVPTDQGILTVTFTSSTTATAVQVGKIKEGTAEMDYNVTYYVRKQ